jgi:hypothetical protein
MHWADHLPLLQLLKLFVLSAAFVTGANTMLGQHQMLLMS